jgi:hypothetical protein
MSLIARTGTSIILCLIGGLGVSLMFAAGLPVAAKDDRVHFAINRLIAAYPNAFTGHDADALRWHDGTLMSVSDGIANKTFSELLRHASIVDQFRIPYPRGAVESPPPVDSDPGRFRHAAFFSKMYGDCEKGQVASHLTSLHWLPKTWGKPIHITSINGVDKQLRAVSEELDALPDSTKRAAYPIAGTYNCRAVADTGQPSSHSYAIAIDVNIAFSDYWYWHRQNSLIAYRNRMPEQIVSIFEKHGFIWGGKWYHFDTMHFEYRPELLLPEP